MKESEYGNIYRIDADPNFKDSCYRISHRYNARLMQEESATNEVESDCVMNSMMDSEDEDWENDQQVMYVPHLQSMENYIKFHYSRTISRDLCRWINSGEGITRNEEEYPVADRSTVRIGTFDFWWSSRTNLVVDVETSVEVVMPECKLARRRDYIVSLFFDFHSRISLVYEDFICMGDFLDRDGMFRLSSYLVPIFKKYEIDKQSEKLLEKHNKPGWERQADNQPEQLAQNLGLSIRRLPLNASGKTRSILFFKRDTVEVIVRDNKNKTYYTKDVTIAPNTIVINTCAVGKTSHKLDIYHECIHYEWHYMFFRLQDMYNNDLRKLEGTQKLIIHKLDPEKKETNPLCWLEFQAKRGSYGLWMPETLMRNEIHQRASNPQYRGLNSGQIYQYVGVRMAEAYHIPKFRIRARMIQLGHWLAMGCLNYEGNGYVEPFSFVAEDRERDYTYFITRKQFYDLYQTNSKFRAQIDTGRFIYVEGHLCLNQPEYVYQSDNGPTMTKAALARVDLCCLRFKNQYWHDASYIYCHGRLNCDDSYNQKFFYFPPVEYDKKNPKPTLPEQILLNEAYISDMPRSFSKQLTKLMKDCHMTIEELAWRSTVSKRTIDNYCSDKYRGYTLEYVLAIVFALHLPPWVSEEFLRAAGFDISTSPESIKYSSVLRTMFMDSVKTVNEFLKTIDLRLIGERKEKKMEELGEYEA